MKALRVLAVTMTLPLVLAATPLLHADGPAPAPSASVKTPPKVKAKLAYVDVERCLNETEDGLRAKAALRKFSDRRQMIIAQIEERLKKEQEDLADLAKNLGPKTPDAEREKVREAALKYQKNLQHYNDTIKKMNNEIAAREDELYNPIEKKIRAIFKKIGEAEGFDLFIDRKYRGAGKSGLVLTDRVIREYNWGKGSLVVEVAPRTLAELQSQHGGALDQELDGQTVIRRVGPSDRDAEIDLAPVLHERGAARLSTSAPILLVAKAVASRVPVGRRWVHPQADRVLALLLSDDAPEPVFDEVGGARIARGAVLGEGVRIAPFAVVHPGARLGARVVVGEGAVIGRPGFGFTEGNPPLRVPHRAGVVIDDDVEIGALCTVDAGILSPTRIGAHSKLDAHVHVGHGVEIGARCRIAAQAGFAGSVVVEDDVRIGGQAGIADHVRIGRGARIAAKAGVIGDVPEGAVFAGYPAVARARWLRGHARLYRK